MDIPISRPALGDEERRAALEVLASGELAKGRRVEDFETAFAAGHGARHGVATNSGTAALTLALLAHGIGAGDEVIVPSFSFFATASSVVSAGATPVFADIDPDDHCLCADAARAAIGPRTRAIMPVHLFGMPANLARLQALCSERGLVLLEDAAQAHGATFAGRPVGSFGTGAFSFFATKNMTTLEGGMLLTNDDGVAERARMLRNHGRGANQAHVVIGGNYRMTEVAAAIGRVQLGRLPALNAARAANAGYFDARLTGVELPRTLPGRTHVYHQYTVRAASAAERDRIVLTLNERGVGARVYYRTPIHREPWFRERALYRDLELPETARASARVFSLPVHPRLSEAERAYIVTVVNEVARSRV
ncbi:MAG TPA: DegT/DnrJ/EryC1/StrS family aminotransferase [Polyangiaceae bacterium]